MDPSPHNGGGEAPPTKSTSEQSSTNKDSPPPPVAPPQMMHNYPPGMGYSGQHQNPYPPPPPNGYAPYPNQPPHGYNYPPQYYGAPPAYHTGNGGRSFCRGFIMCSCLVFSTFFIATIITALVFHPQLPLYNVTSLSVANFNTTPNLSGDWNISISVENPNGRLHAFFSEFTAEVVRQNDAVAASNVPNFEIGSREKKQLEVRASSNKGNDTSFQMWVLDSMTKERESGSVVFGLRVSSNMVYKSGSVSTRDALLVALCRGLKVAFQNNTGSGTLDNGGKPVSCTLFM